MKAEAELKRERYLIKILVIAVKTVEELIVWSYL